MNEVALFGEKTVTTKELAEELKIGESTVKRAVEKLRPVLGEVNKNNQGGYLFNEKQATLIKQEIQKHHNLASRQIDGVSSDYEMELMTQKVLAYHIQKANEYKERAELAEQKLVEQAPKVDFYDTVTQSKDTLDMRNVAITLNIPNTGRNKIFKILRDRKILDRNNKPYQSYVNKGYFKIVETENTDAQGNTHVNTKTVVFQKGLDFINKVLQEELKEVQGKQISGLH